MRQDDEKREKDNTTALTEELLSSHRSRSKSHSRECSRDLPNLLPLVSSISICSNINSNEVINEVVRKELKLHSSGSPTVSCSGSDVASNEHFHESQEVVETNS